MPPKSKLSGLVLLLCAMPMASQAAGNSELERMRLQLEELKKRYEAQNRALQSLEARLRQVEAPGRVQAPPPKGAKAQPGMAAAQRPAPAPQPGQTASAQAARPAVPAAAAADRGPANRQRTAASAAAEKEEKPVVKSAPATRGQEAVLQEAHTLFNRRLTVEGGFTYSRSSRAQITLSGFLALDAIFLGRISVDEVEADILRFDLTGRYGLTDRLQVDVNAPFLYRNTTFTSGGVGGAATRLSEADVTLDPTLGDLNAGLYYQLVKENANWPDTVVNVRVKAPTGTDPFGIRVIKPDPDNTSFAVPEELPSGNGVWTASVGLSFVKTFDPAVLFANLGYFYNFEESFEDIGGAPGKIKLGDSYQFGLGTAIALNERMSLSFSFTELITGKSRTQAKGGEWTSIIGSNANAATFNIGLTFAASDRASFIANVGIGLTSDAPDVQFGIRVPYTF